MTEKDKNRAIAEETCAILAEGFYLTASGTQVDLQAALARSIAGTSEVLGQPDQCDDPNFDTDIAVWDSDTLTAAADLSARSDGQIAILNFASARSPGGGFLRGANAQEESLCRATTLYASLVRQSDFYDRNKAWPNELYSDALLYTPDVLIIRDTYGFLQPDPASVAVITSPAPNTKALVARPESKRLMAEVPSTLARRIDLILGTAAANGHRAVVLGAWGCGVFGNPPDDVARLFQQALFGRYEGQFDNVIFAVAKRFGSENHDAFAARFGAV